MKMDGCMDSPVGAQFSEEPSLATDGEPTAQNEPSPPAVGERIPHDEPSAWLRVSGGGEAGPGADPAPAAARRDESPSREGLCAGSSPAGGDARPTGGADGTDRPTGLEDTGSRSGGHPCPRGRPDACGTDPDGDRAQTALSSTTRIPGVSADQREGPIAMTIAAFLVSVVIGAFTFAEGPAKRPPVPIAGTVVDADRRPAAGAGVYFSVRGGVGGGWGKVVARTEADVQGRFRLEVPGAEGGGPTAGILWAYRPGALVATYRVDRQTLPPDWPIAMVLDHPARAGFLVRGPDGRPVAGARHPAPGARPRVLRRARRIGRADRGRDRHRRPRSGRAHRVLPRGGVHPVRLRAGAGPTVLRLWLPGQQAGPQDDRPGAGRPRRGADRGGRPRDRARPEARRHRLGPPTWIARAGHFLRHFRPAGALRHSRGPRRRSERLWPTAGGIALAPPVGARPEGRGRPDDPDGGQARQAGPDRRGGARTGHLGPDRGCGGPALWLGQARPDRRRRAVHGLRLGGDGAQHHGPCPRGLRTRHVRAYLPQGPHRCRKVRPAARRAEPGRDRPRSRCGRSRGAGTRGRDHGLLARRRRAECQGPAGAASDLRPPGRVPHRGRDRRGTRRTCLRSCPTGGGTSKAVGSRSGAEPARLVLDSSDSTSLAGRVVDAAGHRVAGAGASPRRAPLSHRSGQEGRAGRDPRGLRDPDQ